MNQPAISSSNIAHFKFCAQHFHKSLTLVTSTTEIKGVEALDRFSKLHGYESFNHANVEIRRKTALVEFEDIDIDQATEIYHDVASASSIQESLMLYYDFFFFSHHRSEIAVKLAKISLNKLTNIAHFPRQRERELSSVADFLAVGIMDFSNLTGTPKFAPICRTQFCGVMMMLFDFYEKQLIHTFNFQDVLDLLQPDIYKYAAKIYETTLKPIFSFESTAIGCIDKTDKFMSYGDQESSYQLYYEFLSLISGMKLIKREKSDLHILDYALLSVIAQRGFDEVPPREAIFERLIEAKYLDYLQLDELWMSSPKRKLSQRLTDLGTSVFETL